MLPPGDRDQGVRRGWVRETCCVYCFLFGLVSDVGCVGVSKSSLEHAWYISSLQHSIIKFNGFKTFLGNLVLNIYDP